MDENIIKLDNRTDEATKQILQGVIKRKKKFDKAEQRHLYVMIFTLVSTLAYFVYLYIMIVQPYSYSFSAMFSAYVNDGKNLYFLIITLGSFGLMNLLKEKMDKAEKEYHALRCEIIDKSKDLWYQEDAWNQRHIVFKMMKDKYDINLFHENK